MELTQVKSNQGKEIRSETIESGFVVTIEEIQSIVELTHDRIKALEPGGDIIDEFKLVYESREITEYSTEGVKNCENSEEAPIIALKYLAKTESNNVVEVIFSNKDKINYIKDSISISVGSTNKDFISLLLKDLYSKACELRRKKIFKFRKQPWLESDRVLISFLLGSTIAVLALSFFDLPKIIDHNKITEHQYIIKELESNSKKSTNNIEALILYEKIKEKSKNPENRKIEKNINHGSK